MSRPRHSQKSRSELLMFLAAAIFSRWAGLSFGFAISLSTSTDARNGATTFAYDDADHQTSVTTPAPGTGISAQTTSTAFNNMGWATNVTLPDSTAVVTTYALTGEVSTNSGSRTYPAAYTYDYAGRLKTMTTWTNFASRQGAATTTWNYDAYRGFLTNKAYVDGLGPQYSYTAAGTLKTRILARGTVTTYATNGAGEIATISYSDSTPGTTNTFDRRGRVTTVNTGTNVINIPYNEAGQITAETFNGIAVSKSYNSVLQRTNVALITPYATLNHAYTYDAAGRFNKVSDGTSSASYTYQTNSSLVDSITFKNGSSTRMTTTKSWDNVNRLVQISSAPSADSTISFSYAYNSANQRTSVTNADNSRRIYTYDALGQLTSAKNYWSDGTTVARQQFEYGYDDIGNRIYAASGGNEWGSNLRYENYTANNLNLYTQRTVPNSVDIFGSASNTAIVTVNNRATYRKGDYFRNNLTVDNAASPLFQSITNVGVINNGTNADTVTNITGSLLIPKTPETLTYDLDANLLGDGLWTNTWSGDNRLVATESAVGVPSAGRVKESWSYFPDGRWNERVTYSRAGSNYVAQQTNRFIWQGNRLFAVLDHTNGLVASVMRADASGRTLDAQGASGDPLCTAISGNGTYLLAYDGNGSVAALIASSDGTISANYEYSPFGGMLRETGLAAKDNFIRFGADFYDDITGLCKYLYRDLRPNLGRWLSRDPLGEQATLNTLAFVDNDPLSKADYLGLQQFNVIAEKATQLGAAVDALKPGTSDDFKAPFMKTQLCILQKLAKGACCNSEESAKWLNNVIDKFMNNFLDALNGKFYPDNTAWKPVLKGIPTPIVKAGVVNDPRGMGNTEGVGLTDYMTVLNVSRTMALTHIRQDLAQALQQHGVGSDIDWQCIGNAVKDCQSAFFNWFETTLPKMIAPDSFDIPTIRDNMRNQLKPPFIAPIPVVRNRPPAITVGSFRYP